MQVWQLGSPVPNFTLEGHEKGVNCVDYFQGGEKPYLISGADDRHVSFACLACGACMGHASIALTCPVR
jgi:coatomer subunit beta'